MGNEAAKKLTESVYLLAMARLMSAFGMPICFAVVSWLVLGAISSDKIQVAHSLRLDVLAASNLSQDAAIREIRLQRETDLGRVIALSEAAVRISANVESMTRSIGRIEAYVDNQNNRRQ